MSKKKDNNVELLQEIKKLTGLVGEQLASNDYDGAWQTMGRLSTLAKEESLELSQMQAEALSRGIRNYYYHNKKYNSGKFGLGKVGESLGELSTLIKPEQ